ncbi:hypothetical protein BGW42_000366 [Actinomortierella wolfii]|nr:hypothetical protein BGW42_000366 [Actinomortierella wolfii]
MVAWISPLPREIRELSHVHDPYGVPLEAMIDHDSGYNVVVSSTTCHIWDLNDTSLNPTCYTFPMPRSAIPTIGAHFAVPRVSLCKMDDHTSLLASSSDGQLWYWNNIELCFADYKEPVKATLPLSADDECTYIEHMGSAGYFAVSKRTHLFRITVTRASGTTQLVISQLTNSLRGSVATSLMYKFGITALTAEDQKVIAVASRAKTFGRIDKWELSIMTGQTLIKWTLEKSGQANRESEIYIRDMISSQVKKDFVQQNVLAWNPRVRLLDLSYFRNGALVILASFFKTAEATTTTPLFYGLFIVSALGGEEHTIERVYYVRHPAEEDIRPGGRPRLEIPNGGPNVFIVSSNAIIVTAGSQGQEFEDVVTLKKDCIIGCGSKDSKQWSMEMENSSELNVFFRDSGIIGVHVNYEQEASNTSSQMYGDRDGLSSARSTTLLRDMLEQAVHFGSQPGNPLSFDLSRFEQGDLSQAAVEVSRNILRAHVEYIKQTGDIAFHLNQRIESAENVIKAIRNSHMASHLSTDARFELCMNVEMLRAAAALWNEFQRLKSSSHPMRLQQAIRHMAVDILNDAAAECLGKNEGLGTEEPLATLVKGRVANIGEYLCKVIHRLSVVDQNQLASFDTQDLYVAVGGIILAALHAAYSYRTTHIELYQLKNDSDIIAWTATEKISTVLNDMYNLLLSVCTHESERDTNDIKDGDLETLEQADRVQLVKTEVGQFADAYLQGYSERLNHMQSSRDPIKRAALQDAITKYESARSEILKALIGINLQQKALQLAEKYEDWNTLVELIHSNTEKVDYCMREYKHGFSQSLFAYYDKHGERAKLLDLGERYQNELSLYLEMHPQPELSWLHKLYVSDYASAAIAAQIGGTHETTVERRMAMFSLAKLLESASREGDEVPQIATSGIGSNAASHIDDELELASLQYCLIQQWESQVGVIRDVDERAKAVVESFASSLLKKQDTLAQVIQHSVELLLRHQSLDSESLIDIVMLQGQPAVHGVDVYQACFGICLHASDIPDSRRPFVLQDIWRRIFLADKIGNITEQLVFANASALSGHEVRENQRLTSMAYAYQAAIRAAGNNMIMAHGKLILSPQEALSTMRKEDFEVRFGASLAAGVQKDYKAENQELRRRIDNLQLNDLWQQAQRLAQETEERSLLASRDQDEKIAENGIEKDAVMELD